MTKEVIGDRNVIAGLVPKIGESKQWPVQKENRCEDQSEDVDATKTEKVRRRSVMHFYRRHRVSKRGI